MGSFTAKLGFLSLVLATTWIFSFGTAHAQESGAARAKRLVIDNFATAFVGSGISSSRDPATIVREMLAYRDSNNQALATCSSVVPNNTNSVRQCAEIAQSAGSLTDYTDVRWSAGDSIVCTYVAVSVSNRPSCIIQRGSSSPNPGGFYFFTDGRFDGRVNGEFDANDQEVAGSTTVDAGPLERNSVALAQSVLTDVASLIFRFSTWLLGIAGALFNWIIVKGVFQFSLLIGNSPGLLAAWSILRDLGNILLLFGFIFIGVSTILGTGKFGDKKAIPKLLIFAVLMNFSLFAAEAVIDSANLLASTMYNQASETSRTCVSNDASSTAQGTGEGDGGVGDCAYNYGISGHIIQSSGLASTYAADNPALEPAIMVGLAAFVTVGAVLLFSASFMLITRAVVLTFLMITSPIGFAGMALPPMQKFARQWWAKLIHQAFYAPILLLMIFISLKITDSFTSNMVGERNLAAALQNPLAANMGILLVFALVVGFLVASITMAKKFGMAGADFAVNAAKMPYKLAGRAALGTGRWTARNTVGRGAAGLQKGHARAMANSPKWQQNIMKGIGLDRAINNTLERGKKAKFGGKTSFEDRKKENEARDKELTEVGRKEKNRRKVNDANADATQAQKDLENARLNGTTAQVDAAERKSQEMNDKLAEELDKLTAKEIEELDILKSSKADLDKIAQQLSPEKFAALMKNENGLSEDKKEKMRDLRFKDLSETVKREETEIKAQEQILSANPVGSVAHQQAKDRIALARKNIRDAAKNYGTKDFENMSSTLVSNDSLLQSLSETQRSDLMKNDRLSTAAKRKLRDFDPVEQVKRRYFANNTTNPADAAQAIKDLKLSATQVARLDKDILVRDEVIMNFNKRDLVEIAKKAELTDAQIRKIRNTIIALPAGAGTADLQAYVQKNDFWNV